MTFLKLRDGSRALLRVALASAALVGATQMTLADRIRNPVAVFAGLDKITGRIIAFEVSTGETVQFGSLQITARVCYTRPRTEAPQTTTFVEVDEVDTKNQYKRIFNGWMYAASPGLHGIEHAVYDVWLTDCKGGTTVIADPKPSEQAEAPPASDAARPKPGTMPRPRRTVDPNAPIAPETPAAPAAPGFEPVTGGAPIEVRPPPGAARPPAPNRPTPPAGLPGDLRPPRDIASPPVESRRQPSQRFFPTEAAPGRDPAGNN